MSSQTIRTTLFPAWVLAFSLLTVLMPPATVGATVLMLFVGIAVPAVALLMWKAPTPAVAAVNNRRVTPPNRRRVR